METVRRLGLKRVFFDRIFQKSFWTWRKHPAIIIPTMLWTGLTAIGQAVVTLAEMVVLTNFAARNILFGFLSLEYGQGLCLAAQATPYSGTLLPVGFIAAMLLAVTLVLGGGYVLSAEYATYLEASKSDTATFRSIIENGSRHWKQMAWTLLLTTIITWGPIAAGLILLFLPIVCTPAGFSIGALIAAIYPLIFAAGASLVLAIFTLYSFPVVVVDGLSGFQAIRHSFRVASQNLGVTVTYGVVTVIFRLLSLIIMAFAGLLGVPLVSLATAIISLLLTPVLHSTKTMIYYSAAPAVPEMPFVLENSIWSDIFRRLPRAAWRKVKVGLSESARYIISARNAPFHLASALAFALGLLLGNFVSNNGVKRFYVDVLHYQPGQLNPVLAQVQAPALGIEIFLNNWLVSIAAAMSGIGFAFPSFETIMYNGFRVGIVYPLVPTTTMFLAVILPHGIIEIPSFLLAGSVGIKLGYAALKTLTSPGPESTEYLSTILRQAVYIVVGLAPVFLIAGLIEADLTPVIARLFGWS